MPDLEPDAVPDADPLFISPTAADNAPRIAKGQPTMPVDPEAPYGWMTDPKTGERRPKKSPGRQTAKSATKAATPPANRRANKPRTVSGTVEKASERTYRQKVSELTDTVWMVTAAVPIADAKILGRDIRPVAVRAKAQGALIREQKPALIEGVAAMAEHSSVVARGLDWLSSDGGPGWLIPACMALIPFAVQSAALWRGPIEQAEPLAARSAAEFAELAHAMMAAGNVDQPAAPDQPAALEPPDRG